MSTGPLGSSPLTTLSTFLAPSGHDVSDEEFDPFVDPMAPLASLSHQENIQRAFATIGFSKVFNSFSFSQAHSDSTPLIVQIQSALAHSSDDDSSSPVGGAKRARFAKSTEPSYYSEIPEVKLFAHMTGDLFLDSTPQFQGFDPLTFLPCFQKLIEALPEISGFNKAGYLDAIVGLRVNQLALAQLELDDERIVEVLEQTFWEVQETYKDIKEDAIASLTGIIKAYIALHEFPKISPGFKSRLNDWCLEFYQSIEEHLNAPQIIYRMTRSLCNTVLNKLYAEHINNLDVFCDLLKKSIESLDVGQSIFLPSGFEGSHFGHFCVASITKETSSTYNIRIYNVGLGLDDHYYQLSIDRKTYVQPFIEFSSVPDSILFQQDTKKHLCALMSFFEFSHAISYEYHQHRGTGALEKAFYENLFIYFHNHFKINPSCGYKFIRPQKTGTCVYRSTKAILLDFCASGSAYSEVISHLKARSFYSAMDQVIKKHRSLSMSSNLELDLLLACNQKFSKSVKKRLIEDPAYTAKYFLLLKDIQFASAFLESQKSKRPRRSPLNPSISHQFYSSDKFEIPSLVEKLDADVVKRLSSETKYSDDFTRVFSDLSLEDRFKKLAQVRELTDPVEKQAIENVNITDILKLFNDISLEDPNLFDDVANPLEFLKNVTKVALKFQDEWDVNLNKAICGKAYLMAHKLLVLTLPEFLKDLPISFADYEKKGFLHDTIFVFNTNVYISSILEDCIKYVNAFNESALAHLTLDRKAGAYLFDNILGDIIDLDPSVSRPQGATFHPDYLLYSRILISDPELAHSLISVAPVQSPIYAIKDLYEFPSKKITSPSLEWLYYLKKLNIHFISGEYLKEFYQESQSSTELFKSSSSISTIPPKLIYQIEDTKSQFTAPSPVPISSSTIGTQSISNLLKMAISGRDDVLPHIYKKLKNAKDRQIIDDILTIASNNQTRWLSLCNIFNDSDKTLHLNNYYEVIMELLYRSSKEDPCNTQILTDIQNEHFQTVFVKNLVNAIHTLATANEVCELAVVLLPVLSKILPHINQRNINFEKLHDALKNIIVNFSEEDYSGNIFYLCEVLLDTFSFIDLRLMETGLEEFTKTIVEHYVDYYKEYANLDNKRSIGEAFYKFCHLNQSVITTNPQVAQCIFDYLSEGANLPQSTLHSVTIDDENKNIQFMTQDGNCFHLDTNFEIFIQNADGKFYLASDVLTKRNHHIFFQTCKLKTIQDASGNIHFAGGMYEKATNLFVPASSFNGKLPLGLKDLKWRLESLKTIAITNLSGSLVARNVSLMSPRCDFVLITQKDSAYHFISLDSNHMPLMILTFEDTTLSVFDCEAQKPYLLPRSENTIFKALHPSLIHFHGSCEKFELKMTLQSGCEQVIQFALTTAKPQHLIGYLKDAPHYKLVYKNELMHFPLIFKNITDPRLPEIIFFSPKNLEPIKQTSNAEPSVIFKALVKDGKILSDDLAILCYNAYADFIEGHYEKARLFLDKLNKRNTSLYTHQNHEHELALWLITNLGLNYSKHTLSSSFRRFFILTLLRYFEFPKLDEDLFKPVLKDYIDDKHKHVKESLPSEFIQHLAGCLNLHDYWIASSKKAPYLELASLHAYSPKSSRIDFTAQQIYDIISNPRAVLYQDDKGNLLNGNYSGSNTQVSFLNALEWIQKKTVSKEKLLKFLIGQNEPFHILLKSLIKEGELVNSLDLESSEGLYLKITSKIMQSKKTLLSHEMPILWIPSGRYTPFKTYHAFVTHQQAALQPSLLGTLSLSKKPLLLPLLQVMEVVSDPVVTGNYIQDIEDYNRFIKLFILSQISAAPNLTKPTLFIRSLESLELMMHRVSDDMEKSLVYIGQNHLLKSSQYANEIIITDSPTTKSYELLSFDDLVDAYLHDDLNAYHETTKSFNLLTKLAKTTKGSTVFYQALDYQVGFCLYLKTLVLQLKKIKQQILSGAISPDHYPSTLDIIAGDNALISRPRQQLVFEYRFGHSMTAAQKELVEYLLDTKPGSSPFKLAQMIMGGGKSSVIVPLLSRILTTGSNSCLLITPQSQIMSCLKHLDQSLSHTFNSTVELLDFRSYNQNTSYLGSIYNRLNDNQGKKTLFISTPESLQFLELEFLKLLEKGEFSSLDTRKRILFIQKILVHLKTKTSVLIDEFSHVSDVSKQTNVPLLSGEKSLKKIPESYLTHTEELFKCLTILLQINTLSLQEVSVDWLSYISPLVDLLLTCDTFNRLGINQERIKEFLLDIDNDEFYEDDELCFTKYLLISVLPYALEKTCGRHYGRTFDEQIIAKVVPYQGVGSPATTEFGHFFEAICYHYLTCIQTPYTKQEVAYLMKDLYEKAEANADTFKCDLDTTIEAELFNDAFGFSINDGVGLEAQQKAFIHILTRYEEGDFFPIMKLESILINRYVTLQESYLSSNPHNLISQFSKVSGFTGTPWNKDSYNQVFASSQKFDPSIESSIDISFMSKASSGSLIYTPPYKDPGKILEFFFTHPQFSKISSFIDTGGIFSEFTNIAVAETIGIFYLQKHLALSQFHVIYFDRSEEALTPDVPTLLTASRSPAGFVFTQKSLDGLKLVDLQKAGLSSLNYFVYFDERHTVGTDIALSDDAIGIITVDKKLCHHSFLQGLMRLRQYSGSQNAFVVNFDEKLQTIKDHTAFLDKLKETEHKHLRSIVYRSIKQQIHDTIRKPLLSLVIDKIVEADRFNIDATMALYKAFRSIFVTHEDFCPKQLLEDALESSHPVDSLKRFASKLLSPSIKARLSPFIVHKIQTLIEQAESYFEEEAIVPSCDFDTEVFVENQVEDEAHHQNDRELDADILAEIAYFASKTSKASKVEAPLPISDLLTHFKTKKSRFSQGSFHVAPLFSFCEFLDDDDDACSYQYSFDLMVSSNALLAEDGSYLDILSREKKPITSVLAILHKKQAGGLAFTYTDQIVLVGLTKKETDFCFDYFVKNPESTAVLISLDREILTPSSIEMKVRSTVLKNPEAFVEVYAYNGQARKLMDLIKYTQPWANHSRFGKIRKRFLQIQGHLQECSLHNLVIDKCRSDDTICFLERKEEAELETLTALSLEKQAPGKKADDLNIRIRKCLESLSIERFDKIPINLIPLVPLHLTRHITLKDDIMVMSLKQRMIATCGQKALFPVIDLDELD